MPALSAPPPPAHGLWLALLRRGLITQTLCLAIAAALTQLSQRGAFVDQWLYSAAIGTCCWLFVDGGRQALMHLLRLRHRDVHAQWPGWLWMAVCMVLGSALGYATGTAIADWISGRHTPSVLNNQPAMVISGIATIAATYYFYTTERLHHEVAAADQARRLAVESQLRLLESQLEPHMLFNTLANLRVLIGLDASRAQAMLDRLIAFLRMTLDASRERMHPLALEFDRVADYLALMQIRMGPRLQCELDLPAALRNVAVPPLLLQPLVENAIKHGLEPKVDGGRVQVRAWREGERLVVDVRDTGVGLSDHATADAAGGTATGSRFGTHHVVERLGAVYGTAARFTLEPAHTGEGTLARIELPLVPPAGSSA